MKKRNPITEGMISKFIDNIFTNIKNNQRARNQKALKSDPVSAFGGVVLLNKKIDINLAKIINRKFFEVVVAPKINKKAL